MLRPAVLRAVMLTTTTVATLAAFRSALLTSVSTLQSPRAHSLSPEHALTRRVPAVGDSTSSSSSSVAETIYDDQGTFDIASSTSTHLNGGSPTTSSGTETSSQTSTSSVGSPFLTNSTSPTSTSATMSSTSFIDSFSSSSTTDSLTTATTRSDNSFTPSSTSSTTYTTSITTSWTQTETSFTSPSASTSLINSFTSTSTTTTDTGDLTMSDTTISVTTSGTLAASKSSLTATSLSDTVTSSAISDSETTTDPVSRTSPTTGSTIDPSQTSVTDIVSSTTLTLDSTSAPSDSTTFPGQETSSKPSGTATGSSATVLPTQLPSSSIRTNISPPSPSSSDATTSSARPIAPPDETGIVFSQSGASSSSSPLPSVAAAGAGEGFWHNPGAVAGVFVPLAFAIGGLVFFIGKYLNNRKQNARSTPYHAVPGGNGSGSGLDMENKPFIPAAPISPFYYDPYTDNDATHHSQPVAPSDQPWQRYSDDPRPLERSGTVFSNPSVYSQEGMTSPTDPVLGHERMQEIGAHGGGGQSAGLDGLSNYNPGGAGASQGYAPNMGGPAPIVPNADGLSGGYNVPVPTQTYGASPYLPVTVPPLGYLSTHVEESEPESDDEERTGGGPPLPIRNRRRFDENSCIDEPARARLLQVQEPEP